MHKMLSLLDSICFWGLKYLILVISKSPMAALSLSIAHKMALLRSKEEGVMPSNHKFIAGKKQHFLHTKHSAVLSNDKYNGIVYNVGNTMGENHYNNKTTNGPGKKKLALHRFQMVDATEWLCGHSPDLAVNGNHTGFEGPLSPLSTSQRG